jgi:hypothetical protein
MPAFGFHASHEQVHPRELPVLGGTRHRRGQQRTHHRYRLAAQTDTQDDWIEIFGAKVLPQLR